MVGSKPASGGRGWERARGPCFPFGPFEVQRFKTVRTRYLFRNLTHVKVHVITA